MQNPQITCKTADKGACDKAQLNSTVDMCVQPKLNNNDYIPGNIQLQRCSNILFIYSAVLTYCSLQIFSSLGVMYSEKEWFIATNTNLSQ